MIRRWTPFDDRYGGRACYLGAFFGGVPERSKARMISQVPTTENFRAEASPSQVGPGDLSDRTGETLTVSPPCGVIRLIVSFPIRSTWAPDVFQLDTLYSASGYAEIVRFTCGRTSTVMFWDTGIVALVES